MSRTNKIFLIASLIYIIVVIFFSFDLRIIAFESNYPGSMRVLDLLVDTGVLEKQRWACPMALGNGCEAGYGLTTTLLHWFHLVVFATFYLFSLGVNSISNS